MRVQSLFFSIATQKWRWGMQALKDLDHLCQNYHETTISGKYYVILDVFKSRRHSLSMGSIPAMRKGRMADDDDEGLFANGGDAWKNIVKLS